MAKADCNPPETTSNDPQLTTRSGRPDSNKDMIHDPRRIVSLNWNPVSQDNLVLIAEPLQPPGMPLGLWCPDVSGISRIVAFRKQ